jgi:branched-chain amino acid transport system substrate-binding protein
MVSTAYLKDPTDQAKWANDPGVQLFRTVMQKYGNGCDPSGADAFCVSGMASAYTLTDVLKQAGSDLTRKHIMDIAAKNLNEKDNPLLLPGVVVKTTSKDHFPIQQEQLERWQGDRWTLFGDLINVRQS